MKEINRFIKKMLAEQSDYSRKIIKFARDNSYHIFVGHPARCMLCGLSFGEIKKNTLPKEIIFDGRKINVYPNCNGSEIKMESKTVQFWKNGVFMTCIDPKEADEIVRNYKEAGYKIYDNREIGYISVEKRR